MHSMAMKKVANSWILLLDKLLIGGFHCNIYILILTLLVNYNSNNKLIHVVLIGICLCEMACILLQLDQSDDLLYVKKGNEYCGYRREYLAQNLSRMEEGFVACKKCSGIMREASLSKGETICLVCSDTPRQPNPVKAVQDSIRVLEIKCPLLRDCDWKGELSEAETHLKDCLFFLIQCKKCEQIFPRGEKEKHESDSCPKRIINCEYCEMSGKAEYKEEHLATLR